MARAFDRHNDVLFYWDLDKAPLTPDVKVEELFDNVTKSLNVYDDTKKFYRLVVYGDFTRYGGVEAFRHAFKNGRNTIRDDKFQFFHLPQRRVACYEERCQTTFAVRYPNKEALSHSMLKQMMLRDRAAYGGAPYHIVLVTSDAHFVHTINLYKWDGFIVHVACFEDAHPTLKKAGHVRWMWLLMAKGLNHPFVVLTEE